MSSHYYFNFSLFDGLPVAAILLVMTGGGGTLAAIRRNWRRAREADLEAFELGATAAVQARITVEATGTAEGSGIGEATGTVERDETLEAIGAIEGSLTLDVGDDGDASN